MFASTIFGAFLVVVLLQLVAVLLVPCQFDISSSIVLSQFSKKSPSIFLRQLGNVIDAEWLRTNLLDKLVSWDSVYFLKLASDGIAFEHEWVFGPLFWRMFHYFFRASTQNIYDTLALSMLVNLCCHLVSCILIFMLTVKVFEGTKNISSNRLHLIATACSLLCIIQPSGIFSTVVCAESISQMLCYLGLYSRVAALKMSLRNSKSVLLYLLSGLLFATAFGFRSNCLLYGILYLYDLYGGLRKAHFSKMFWAILSGLIILSALILSLYVPYAEYCPLRGEWCASSTKSLVSFAQKYYWNVGFLNYFTLGNIPLFIIAFPQLLVILLSLIYFHSFEAIRGEWLVTVVYLFLQLFVMHVQIVNRVSTFLPIHFWFLAFIHSGDNNSVVFLYSQKFARYVILFWTVWIFVQAGLYGSFLPPA